MILWLILVQTFSVSYYGWLSLVNNEKHALQQAMFTPLNAMQPTCGFSAMTHHSVTDLKFSKDLNHVLLPQVTAKAGDLCYLFYER